MPKRFIRSAPVHVKAASRILVKLTLSVFRKTPKVCTINLKMFQKVMKMLINLRNQSDVDKVWEKMLTNL